MTKKLTRLVHAADDALQLVLGVLEGLGKNVTDSKVNRLLVQVVLEDDEPRIELGDVGVEDLVEAGQGGLTVGSSTWDVPVGLIVSSVRD